MGLRRKRAGAAESPPALLDRVVDAGARRIAILGLHPRAGSRTVLAGLVRELHERGRRYGVTSFPRPPEEDEPEPTTQIALPEGATVATGLGESGGGAPGAALELLELTRYRGPLGRVGYYRVAEGTELRLCGPREPAEMGPALSRLADLAGGPALVDGGWGRRGFAAPGACDGIILVVGAGYSGTPERSAAAVRYVVESFRADECLHDGRRAWERAVEANAALLLDGAGAVLGEIPAGAERPLPTLEAAGKALATIALPRRLGDDLLAPMVRSRLGCTLIVRDATRLQVAPVYLRAWQKGGGRVQVVHRAHILAVAANPVNVRGSDADPEAFVSLLREALGDVPVHDVVLESREPARRPVWKFWE